MNFEDLIYHAILNEKAERYDDMAKNMKEAVEIARKGNLLLGLKERSLYSVAFKNVVGHRRASWRILTSERKKNENNERNYKIIDEYVKKVEGELNETCDELLEQVKEYLKAIEGNADFELKIFLMKMIGDYYRYKSEILESEENVNGSFNAYNEAWELAVKNLQPTNPVRLGLALNFSVFYYEIGKNTDKACSIAKQAFDDSIDELDKLSEEHYKDSTLIMQLLRDNLTLWTSGDDEDEEQK